MSFDIYPAVIEFDCPALMLLDSSLIYFIVYFLRRQLDYALLVNKDSSTRSFKSFHKSGLKTLEWNCGKIFCWDYVIWCFKQWGSLNSGAAENSAGELFVSDI